MASGTQEKRTCRRWEETHRRSEDCERAFTIRKSLLDLCFERGYPNLMLPALLEHAGVKLADFERHFADLEDCFHQVYKAELERYRGEASRAREDLSDWRQRLRATGYALYRFLAPDEKLRRFAVVDVRAAGGRTRALFGSEMEAHFDLIDEGRGEPGAPSSLTRTTAECVGGGIFNQVYLAAGRGGPIPPEPEIVPQMLYTAVLPYVGAEAAAKELSTPPPPRPAG